MSFTERAQRRDAGGGLQGDGVPRRCDVHDAGGGHAQPAGLQFTGLNNGQPYDVQRDGQECARGWSCGRWRAATPRTLPGAPTAARLQRVTPTHQSSWAPPANDGGAAITKYTAVASPGGVTAHDIRQSCTVAGLTNGQAYTFTVVATNAAGDGPTSAASAAVTPQSATQTATVKIPEEDQVQGQDGTAEEGRHDECRAEGQGQGDRQAQGQEVQRSRSARRGKGEPSRPRASRS